MKVLKRNYEHKNLIIFLIFSMAYLQVIYSLSRGISVLSAEAIKLFFQNHYLLFSITLVTIIMILNVKRNSDKYLLVCLSLISAKNFIMLATSFNKLILGLNFVYVLFAFYFFMMWELEINKASYNPLFSKNDLEKEPRFQLQAKLENVKTGESLNALITNIDEDGCFLLTESFKDIQLSSSANHYKLSAVYEDVEFIHPATAVTSYDRGLGLEFGPISKRDNQLNWSDLYKICLERGLFS